MTLISEVLRENIKSGKFECLPSCRHGWPDIYHSPYCEWQQAIEEIYRLEREDEELPSNIHCE